MIETIAAQTYSELIRIRGSVQGVGFRPLVWRLAHQHKIRGEVLNDEHGVLIHVQSTAKNIEKFLAALQQSTPAQARIDSLTREKLKTEKKLDGFSIAASHHGSSRTEVLPDLACCPDCIRDFLDPDNRRYLYPFTSCTHCGPRYSIIHDTPYDRENTSMQAFKMCPSCLNEYNDPDNRRFHSQTNCCPQCGPQYWIEDNNSRLHYTHASIFQFASQALNDGKILAIKGIGGFHLICDATQEKTIARLRKLKQRPHKPLALMAACLTAIKKYVFINQTQVQQLNSTAAPIVLLKTDGQKLPENIAPGLNRLGFMLPYAPVHHLLFHYFTKPLVVTSGNAASSPLCADNHEARQRLTTMCDFILMHDRAILHPVDDSLVQTSGSYVQTIRRSRGLVPQSIDLPEGFQSSPDVFALGAEVKNTVCQIQHQRAKVSEHFGDLKHAGIYQSYRDYCGEIISHAATQTTIAVDTHPSYFSSRTGETLALENNLTLEKIQHHHAHLCAVMLEHGIARDASQLLGIAFDGIGLGNNQSAWGGEFMLLNYQSFERIASLQAVALPGGNMCASQPWRNTVAHLEHALGWQSVMEKYSQLDIVQYLHTKPTQQVLSMIQQELNAPPASSTGRLFDAVAAAIGLCRDEISYEGQAAMQLEAIASPNETRLYPFAFIKQDSIDRICWKGLWQGILDDLSVQLDSSIIAAKFINTLTTATCRMTLALRERHHFDTVVLSGGTFQNMRLSKKLYDALEGKGLSVLRPARFPCNDGGIALGQAIITTARHNS